MGKYVTQTFYLLSYVFDLSKKYQLTILRHNVTLNPPNVLAFPVSMSRHLNELIFISH